MNLTEMRRNFATKVGVSQEKAKELIAALEETVVEGLLGSLETREVAERTGRNPQTGESMIIPGKVKVAYKQSSKIKEIVNE